MNWLTFRHPSRSRPVEGLYVDVLSLWKVPVLGFWKLPMGLA
jgi:hypothetical protein